MLISPEYLEAGMTIVQGYIVKAETHFEHDTVYLDLAHGETVVMAVNGPAVHAFS